MIEELLRKIERHSEELETIKLQPLSVDEWAIHSRYAHWAELPLFKNIVRFGTPMVFSVRISPERPMQDWTVVAGKPEETGTMTYASSLRTFLSNYLLREYGLYGLSFDNFDAIFRLQSEVFGSGDFAILEQLRDDLLPKYRVEKKQDKRLSDLQKGEVLKHCDPDPQHVQFRTFLTNLIEHGPTEGPLPHFGPWTSWAALTRRLSLPPLDDSLLKLKSALAFDVVHNIPQYDGCMLAGFQLRHVDALPRSVFSNVMEDAARLFAYEHLIVPDSPYWQDDIGRHIIQQHNAMGGGYNGRAHLEAAALYDENRNDPLRSYESLQSGTFWALENGGVVLRPALDAAISLAARRNWHEVEQALRWNAKIMA